MRGARGPVRFALVAVLPAVLMGCGGAHVVEPAVTPTPTVSPTPSSPGVPSLPDSLAGHLIWRIPTTGHVIALTFDGGSGAQGADSVISTLSTMGVRGSFFLTGTFVHSYPSTAARIGAAHVVGNHTMTHPHMNALSDTGVRNEVATAASMLRTSVGTSGRPWFRFPFGEYDGRTLRLINALGYAGIGWTIDTLGWKGRLGAGSADDVVARVMADLQPGAIVLMHLGAAPDGSTLDADALPALIAAIRGAGYSFTTLRALL